MNQEELQTVKDDTMQLLIPDYAVWRWMELPKLTEQEEEKCIETAIESVLMQETEENVEKEHASAYAAACQCLYLSRKLHVQIEDEPKKATLVGDYLFSRFAHFMTEIDHDELYQLFADFLIEDTRKEVAGAAVFDESEYLNLVKTAPARLKNE